MSNELSSAAEGRKDFLFSFVMAVYNVEQFLSEAVESLIAQSIGFEDNIQLVLVDDGSDDGSGDICDSYQRRYPHNVIVIHKENGGVSSARNEGMKHATGRFISFMDSDDKIAGNTCRLVSIFFRNHTDVDVVAIPMFFFDARTGAHVLNDKFKKGTRVINLRREYDAILLSTSAAFLRREVLDSLQARFDQDTMFTEDAKFLVPILCRTMKLGVVKECKYFYRKRSEGHASASQQSSSRREWWLETLRNFHMQSIQYCLDTLGYVPSFVQYLIAYDLQWRVMIPELPDELLTQVEQKEYLELLCSILRYIDDDIILKQKSIYIEHMKYMLECKYGPECCSLTSDKTLMYMKNIDITSISKNKTVIDFLSIEDDLLYIEGYHVLLAYSYESVFPAVLLDNETIYCQEIERNKDKAALGTPITKVCGFSVRLPLNHLSDSHVMEIGCVIDGVWVKRTKLSMGKYSMVPFESETVWNTPSEWSIKFLNASFTITRASQKDKKRNERAYCLDLLKRRKASAAKAVIARFCKSIISKLIRKPIWLFADRFDRADDNAEALYSYVVKNASDQVMPIFIINKKSPDYGRVKQFGGKVLAAGGWWHKLAYLLSECVCSSQADEWMIRPFREFSALYQDQIYNKKFIFLQHGITQNDVSNLLNKYNKNISLFVTASRDEYKSIIEYPYYYTKDEVKLTGFPRFDRLSNECEKVISIMPTWRSYLVGSVDQSTGKRTLKAGFSDSTFYDMYQSLLSNPLLFDAAERNGYRICLVMHPNMTAAISQFAPDSRLQILPSDTSYREVFSKSALIVTDYSSVAFDFAYLRKPVVYFQKDYEEFFSGAHTLNKGYFDYSKNGFGEQVFDIETLIKVINEYIRSDCKIKEKYLRRIDSTFPFSDRSNSERVYLAMLEKGCGHTGGD